MGKKKQQFINKKNAASFHIIHRPSAPDATSEAASSSLSLSSAPPLSAAGAPSSAYYFQPSSRATAIPAGFPLDLLASHNSEHELAELRKERRTALQRSRDSVDPTLLPHEYDYSAHLRAIGGGVFIAAAGAASFDSAASKRERQQREQQQQQQLDARNQQPAVDEQLEREVDWELVRRAEKEGRKRRRGQQASHQPAMDVMLALEQDEQVPLVGEEGELDELEDDFVIQAMKGSGDADSEEEEDEAEEQKDEVEEDDMLAKIRQYELHEMAAEGGEDESDDEDGEDGEDGEDWEVEESHEPDDEDDLKSSQGEIAVLSQRKLFPGQRHSPPTAASGQAAAEDGEDHSGGDEDEQSDEDDSAWDDGDDEHEREDEVHALPSRALDKDFDRLLSEQYSNDDIGGLDDVDESLVSGQLSIDSFAESLDAFLSRQSLPVSRGGSDLSLPSAERDTIKRRMVRRLRAMSAEEGHEVGIEHWMSDVYKQVVEDGWDVESIVSTYSNTENHPTAIREQRSRAAVQQANKRKEQAQAALAAAITAAVQPTEQDEDEAVEDGEDKEAAASRNLGVARPRGESADEKRARKAAWKAEKRESRQRKKQLRTLYASLEHNQLMQHTKASVDNPAGRQLI